jgi:hypothetical protein
LSTLPVFKLSQTTTAALLKAFCIPNPLVFSFNHLRVSHCSLDKASLPFIQEPPDKRISGMPLSQGLPWKAGYCSIAGIWNEL